MFKGTTVQMVASEFTMAMWLLIMVTLLPMRSCILYASEMT